MKEYRNNKTKTHLLFYILTFFLAISASHDVFAQNKKELENKKKKLQSDIKLTKELLEETKQNKKQSLNQLVTLNKKISMQEELINTINTEVNIIDRQILENELVIKNLETDLQQLKEEYAQMIKFAYKNKNSYDRMMFVFASKDFNQAYNRLKYMQQYSEYRQKQGKQIERTQKIVNDKITELHASKGEKVNLAQEKETEVKTLSVEKGEKEKSLVELQKKEKQLRAELKKKQEDAAKLQAAIQAIIVEEIRKAKELAAKEAAKKEAEAKARKEKEKDSKKKEKEKESETTTTATKTKPTENKTTSEGLILTPEAQLLSSSFESNKSRLPWPVAEGIVTNTFGEHEHPVLHNIKVKNNGIDISTKKGAAARAIYDGEVTGVISIPNAGKAVIVRHGEYLSVYANLGSVMVEKGDKIKTKQTIGSVMIDEEEKSEIHLEIWKGSNTLDPQNWIYRSN